MKKITTISIFILMLFALVNCSKTKYQVTFVVNDDSETVIVKKVKSGATLSDFDFDYIKKTYLFDYWLNEKTNLKFDFKKPIEEDLTIIGVWKEDGIRRGTFGREYPSYYEKDVPLIEDAHVVYINLDGFARYYYDEALSRDENNLPTLRSILAEGVFFQDFRTTAPSVTNPVQNMIISGATSAITKNVYRYYDRNTNVVIQQARENAAETIVDRVVDADLSIASVSFYLAESRLTSNDPRKLYIPPDTTNPKVVARGTAKSTDYFSRFEQAIKLVKGEPIKVGSQTIVVEELPKLIIIYADDLDAHGHNESTNYGVPVVHSEAERLDKMVTSLIEIDEKLGEFIAAAKEVGVYDKMTFILTTDHGMTSFGALSNEEGGNYIPSKFGELKYALKQFDNSFELEKVDADKSPSSRTTVVGVGMNLNLQLTFLEDISDERLEELKALLLKEDYVGVVKTRKELEEEGYWTYAADMIVSPASRYNFSSLAVGGSYLARGQHDSYLDSSNHIYGMIWGNQIKKGVIYEQRAYCYDVGITIAAILGLDLPLANGIVLDVFEREE